MLIQEIVEIERCTIAHGSLKLTISLIKSTSNVLLSALPNSVQMVHQSVNLLFTISLAWIERHTAEFEQRFHIN